MNDINDNDQGTMKTPKKQHILTCISASPSNERVLRIAKEMAETVNGEFTALYVETSETNIMKEESRKLLHKNMHTAEKLGAEVESVYGEDVAFQISEYARLHNVTTIVIGRSISEKGFHLLPRPTLVEKLLLIAPEIDIHIIPDKKNESKNYHPEKRGESILVFSARDILIIATALIGATLIGIMFHALGFTDANIIMVYLLSIMLSSAFVTNRIYIFVASLAEVIIFNFFFTEPKYTFLAYDQSYPVTFIIMFLAGIFTGTLASRLKDIAQQAARASYRTRILFDTNQMLSGAHGTGAIVRTTARQLHKLLERDIVVYLSNHQGELEEPQFFPFEKSYDMPKLHTLGLQNRLPLFKKKTYSDDDDKLHRRDIHDKDFGRTVASWTMRNNKRAGATTDIFPDAAFLYYALRVDANVYGVVGIALQEPLEAFENSIMLSMLGECSLALENDRNQREKEEAHVQMVNEQLRADLLRSISHDLRTPLTSISGNASNLLNSSDSFDEATKKRLYTDIYDDSMWLISLVENLLAISRISEGRMDIHMHPELIDDVIQEALKHIDRKSKEHEVIFRPIDEYLVARMDERLIIQVIINLINNAIKYSPVGSRIIISTKLTGEMVSVIVSDDGNGISAEDQKHIFEMFYTGSGHTADSQRSLGLGLALCKSIVEAHGGTIRVSNTIPHGCTMTFTLKHQDNGGDSSEQVSHIGGRG